MNIQKIEAIEAEVKRASMALSASEGWADGWRDQPESFKLLLSLEADMARLFRDYLRQLSKRISSYIAWSQYHQDVVAVQASEDQAKALEAYDINVLFDGDGFEEDEENQLESLIREIYINGISLGVLSQYAHATGKPFITKIVTPESPLYTTIQNAATEHVAQLAQWLDKTTAQLVVDSIQESIALGENIDLAMARLSRYIDDPIRASRIAQTESVRSFAIGGNRFALRNGASQKFWQALPGADNGGGLTPCLDNDGVTVDILDAFPSGDEINPAHPYCRCRVDYIYPDGTVIEDV